jgi:hypothetical protein
MNSTARTLDFLQVKIIRNLLSVCAKPCRDIVCMHIFFFTFFFLQKNNKMLTRLKQTIIIMYPACFCVVEEFKCFCCFTLYSQLISLE